MILVNMLRYITRNKWNVVQLNQNSLRLIKRVNTNTYIDVTKNTLTDVVASIPILNNSDRVSLRFGCEMHAYEYLENYILDDTGSDDEDGKEFNDYSISEHIGMKRKYHAIM